MPERSFVNTELDFGWPGVFFSSLDPDRHISHSSHPVGTEDSYSASNAGGPLGPTRVVSRCHVYLKLYSFMACHVDQACKNFPKM